MSGWVKIHRQLLNWGWSDSPKHMALFLQLLLRANHKQTKWRKETIDAGQLLTGRKQLSTWSGLSERGVRTVLCDLETTSEVTIKKSNKYSIITICNWSKYQGRDQQNDQQTTSKRPASDQQVTTSKNVKKEKKEKNKGVFDFEAVYKNYPRKEGKKKGFEKLTTIIKTQGDYDNLLLSVENYSEQERESERKHIKHFSTFVNCYEDYIRIELNEKDEAQQKRLEEIYNRAE
jgi:hypothetical protein